MKYPIVSTQAMRAITLLCVCIGSLDAIANDALFQSTELTPDKLVEQVLKRNPGVRLRQVEHQESLARIPQASALDDPMFSYSMAPETRYKSGQDFGQKWMLSQKIPWPGKRDLAAQAQTFESKAAKQQVGNEELQLTLKARRAYADWYYVHAAMHINEKSKALWQEFQHLAELNYTTGRASKQDVLKAEVEYYRLQHRDISLERKRKAARSKINLLLNRDPDGNIPPPADLTEIEIRAPAIKSLLKTAVATRPELLAITEKIHGARSRVKRTDLNDYPDFKLMAGWNSLWTDEDKRWTIGISFNLPIDPVKRGAAKDEANAKLLRLRTQQEQLRNQVQAEVQDAFDVLVEAQHVLKLYRQKLLPTARENLAASKSDYESGSGDFLSLISAEKSLFQTQLETEKAKADLYRSSASLKRAVAIHSFSQQTNSQQDRFISSLSGGSQ